MSSHNILMVEDEPYYQKVYGKVLEGAGYGVTYVNNGEDALKALKESSYDLLIVDLIMPIVSGLKFLEKIKRKKHKIIVLTTLEGDTDRQDALNSGADDFLIKTETKPQQLLEHIDKMLNS